MLLKIKAQKLPLTTATATDAATTPHWPALLHQQNVEELLYLENNQDWEQLLAASYLLNLGDRLVDSAGTIWGLTFRNKQVQLLMSGMIPLSELQQLIQAHALLDGSCCVSKLQINSVTEAIQFVKSLS